MDFNLDDPLGDILSDGSDDSLFGTSTKTKTTTNPISKPAATSISSVTPKNTKSKIENLFGVSEPSAIQAVETTTSVADSYPTTSTPKTAKKPSSPSTLNTVVKKPEPKTLQFNSKIQDNDDDDDLLADLGFDPKKPKSTVKKSNILDDLLGIDTTPTPPIKLRSSASSSTLPRQPLSRQSTIEKPDLPQVNSTVHSTSMTNRPPPRQSPLVKRKSSITLADPLGFFTNPTEKSESHNKTVDIIAPAQQQVAIKSSSADWLGLTPTSGGGGSESVNEAKSHENIHQNQPTQITPTLSNLFNPTPIQTTQLIATANQETNAALQNLQQQEVQLIVANQMKSQEVALQQMQQKQQALLQQQEKHFNDLVQKQIRRQGILEENIKWQQERIQSHIQVLMAQPDIPPPSKLITKHSVNFRGNIKSRDEDDDANDDDYDDDGEDSNPNQNSRKIHLKSEIKHLELEKLRLEDLLQTIKSNHDQEFDFLDQSHRKQIQLLEENQSKVEERLRSECQNLENFYLKKVEVLELEINNLKKNAQEKYTTLEETYSTALIKLKTHHLREIDEIQAEHKKMLENLRQSKIMEFSLVQENTSYLQKLQTASGFLENASDDLQSIRVELDTKINRLHAEKESTLVAREQRLEQQQNHFEKLRAATESERVKLLELVGSLELKLQTVNQNSEEEQWALRQQRATLDAERAAHERERTFARECFVSEEKRFDELKTQQMDEIQRWQKQIQVDRQEILVEKMKLETMAKLQRQPTDASVSQSEIEAAVHIAQDAARQSDMERERLLEMQRQVETKRRELIDQENGIRLKITDMETNLTRINLKEKNAEAKLLACKKIEQKFLDKLRDLQRAKQELTQRETKISQSRYELSRDRLELQSIRKQLYQNRCSLCKIGERSQEMADILLSTKDGSDKVAGDGAGGEIITTEVHDLPNLEFEHLNYGNLKDTSQIDELLDREMSKQQGAMSSDYDAGNDEDAMADLDLFDADLTLAKFSTGFNSTRY